jgi:AcrR family transcriptional regulator
MGMIAQEVGITAGALYRHFRNKPELLYRVLLDGLDAFEAAVAGTARADLDGLLRAMAALAMDRRELGVLWQRESRHLPEAEHAEVRRRFRMIAAWTSAVLREGRPELPPSDVDLLVWAAFAVFASPSRHAVRLPRARFEELLYAIGATVVAVTAPAEPDDPRAVTPPAGLVRASRREALVDAAIRLFGERGYQAVSVEDIGSAAGISGAGIYHHVTAKSDLLVAALTRASEALQLDASRAFAAATGSREALALLLRSYVTLAVTYSQLIATLVSEVVHLPDEQRHAVRRLQHDYVGEWVQLLAAERPALTEPESRVIVHAVLSIVNDVAGTGRLRRRPDLAADLVRICEDVLRHVERLNAPGRGTEGA